MATPKQRNNMTKKELMAFRAEYEPRVKKLEHDVFEWLCSRDKAKKIGKVKSEHSSDSDSDKKMAVSWQYDMKEFSLEEISLHHEGSSLLLRAIHKSPGESLEMNNEIVLPENVDESKISCKMSSSGILTITVFLKPKILEENR